MIYFFIHSPGSCNHVAGLLFRIEAAVLEGLTDETCTMRSCLWNVPSGKKQIKPGKISDFLIKQDRYDKKFMNDVGRKKDIQTKKIEYDPVPKVLKPNIINQKVMRKKIFDVVKDIVPKSTFVETFEGKEKTRLVQYDTNQINKLNLIHVAQTINTFNINENDTRYEKILTEYISNLRDNSTNDNIEAINHKTKKQSDCDEWHNQRKGRITASKFKRVFTRMRSLKNNPDCDPSILVSTILGYDPVVLTRQMKHGITMERHAKKAYKSMYARSHKRFQVEDWTCHFSNTPLDCCLTRFDSSL